MMGMGFSLSLRVALKCETCTQFIDDQQKRIETRNLATLFGHVFYTVCWTCSQEVPESLRTPSFRRAWLEVVVKKAEETKDERVLWALARLLKMGAGFKPNERCLYGRKAMEFITYPFVENGKVVIYVREVDQPTTLQKDIPIEKAIPRSKKASAVLQGLLG